MNKNDEPLPKPLSLIVKLNILDAYGRIAKSPYPLENGANEFSCEATYIDGSKETFPAYWTCPMHLSRGTDFYGALGVNKQSTVKVNAAPNHIKYSALACWVKFPDRADTDAGQYPNATISFDYSGIVNE